MASDDVIALLTKQVAALVTEVKLIREELVEHREDARDRGSGSAEDLPARWMRRSAQR